MIHPAFQYPQPAASAKPHAALIGSFECSGDDMTARGGLLGGKMCVLEQNRAPALSRHATMRAAFTP